VARLVYIWLSALSSPHSPLCLSAIKGLGRSKAFLGLSRDGLKPRKVYENDLTRLMIQ
jgi:hypothetical protein